MERVYKIGNDRKRLHSVLSMLANFLLKPDADIEIVVRDTVYKRSTEQNRRYRVILNQIAEVPHRGVLYSADTWHVHYASEFIGTEEILMPDGSKRQDYISTTTLDRPEFSDYMTRIEVDAAERGILLDLDAIAA